MLSIRRPTHEARIEIMPLIDVIFLLLTFFIYAMVLMIRVDQIPIEMQQFASGEPARPAPAVTVSIDRHGDLYLGRDPVSMDEVLERLKATREENPDLVVYIAADATGDTDRLPTFLSLVDRLGHERFDMRLRGKPPDGGLEDR